MANNDTKPDRPKAFLRASRFVLLTLCLAIGGLLYSFELSRNDLSRQLDLAQQVQEDSSQAISALLQKLPATLSAVEVEQISTAAELRQADLKSRAQALEPHSAGTMEAIRAGGVIIMIAVLLWLAWGAYRMEREIARTDEQMKGRLSVVEMVLGFMKGKNSLEDIDAAITHLHEIKGDGIIDRRVRRVFQALQDLRQEVVAKMDEVERLRAERDATSEAAAEAETERRAMVTSLQSEIAALHDRLAGVDRHFDAEAISRLQGISEDRREAARELIVAQRRISSLERQLEVLTDRLDRSLDLNAKTVKMIGQAEELVAAVAKASTKINERAGKISGIVSKTDMLSLNASIEAVKAGTAGRGFAVVAEEVKGVVGQITDQLAFVMQETVEVHGGSEKTSTVIKQVVELASASDDIRREIEAASEEMEEGFSEFDSMDDLPETTLPDLHQAQADLEGIQRALKALSQKIGSTSA